MPHIDASLVRQTVRDLSIKACVLLPGDVLDALLRCREAETESLPRDVMDTVIANALTAGSDGVPICQDTGMTHVFIDLGQDAAVKGDLCEAVQRGVAQACIEGRLRKSVVKDPLFHRVNTGDNTPALIHVESVPGPRLQITVMPKGTGSENMSGLTMLTPSAGVTGVVRFVVEVVRKAGANACPPMIVGVGVGGMMDKAAFLAKKALLRKAGEPHPDPDVANLEREIMRAVNDTGIGPAGLGGRTTAIGVAVETFPTHMGALPVAVNLQCHAARRASATIAPTEDGGRVLVQPEPTKQEWCGTSSQPTTPPAWRHAKRIRTPFTDENQAALPLLRSGEKVLISGTVYTARDAAHKRMTGALECGGTLPFDLRGQVIYYAGPCPAGPGQVIGSIGPTTSGRMDAYAPALISAGLKGMIGKGERSVTVKNAMVGHGAVYFVAVGGAGAVLSRAVAEAKQIAYPDLGPEAVYRLRVEDFPAIVGIDAVGNDIYDRPKR